MQSDTRQQKILFVLSHPPQNGTVAEDCLDAVMTAALLNQLVGLLFVGDGVYQLTEPSWAARITSLGELAALKLYAAKQDLEIRALEPRSSDNGLGSVEELEGVKLAALFERYDRVLSF